MFKKKKRKEKGLKEITLPIEKEEKRKPDIHVRIEEEDNYVVLDPFDMWNQKKTSIEQKPKISKEVIQIKEKKPKEEVKPKEESRKGKKLEEKKPEKVKPKLVIRKIKPKEIKPPGSVQKVLPKPPEKIAEPEEHISEIPIDHIETDIDKLMRIIDEKGIVGLEYLSKALKISVDRLENWAKMLEDRGLIEIEYPIIGLPKLRKKEWKKKS